MFGVGAQGVEGCRDRGNIGWYKMADCVGIGPTVVLCYEFERMTQFWHAALDFVVGHTGSPGFYTSDQRGEVDRLIGLGATSPPLAVPARRGLCGA